jgi:phage gp45-like
MISTINREISKRLGQIRQVFLGIVTLSGQSVQVQGLNDELLSDIEVIQHVGFASNLPKGCRVVVMPMMGKTNRAVVIASDKAKVSVVVEDGELCIYDQFGHKIFLKQDGVYITGQTFIQGDLAVTGGITATEDIAAEGDVSDGVGSIAKMRLTFNEHAGHYSPINKIPDTPME